VEKYMDNGKIVTGSIWFCDSYDVQYREYELDPPGDDEIQCKSVKSLISQGSEVVKYTRDMDDSMHKKARESGAPFEGGYANSAVVVALGKNVTDFKIGEMVACTAKHSQYFNVKRDAVTHVPEWVSHEENAWMTMLRTGLYSCMVAGLKPMDSVIIAGAGAFGMSALIMCKIYNAKRIVMVEPDEYRAALAEKMGATTVFHGKIGDYIERAIAENDGKYYDVAIDATAWAGNIKYLQACVKNGGNISIISDPPNTDHQIMNYGLFHYRGQHVHGTFINMQIPSSGSGGREHYNQFYPFSLQDCHDFIYEKMRTGEIRVKELISGFVSPRDCASVYKELYENRGPKLGLELDWELLK